MREFRKNNVLNILIIELRQLRLLLLLHIVFHTHTPMTKMIFRQVQRTVGFGICKFDVVAIDVGGLTWRQVDNSNLRFNCVGGFTWLSRISTFSSRHKIHNLDRRWQVLD